MPKVIVTCPDRAGLHSGFYSAAGFFGVGTTEAELTDDQVALLRGEIERKESILAFVVVPDEPAPAPSSDETGEPKPLDEPPAADAPPAPKGKGKK